VMLAGMAVILTGRTPISAPQRTKALVGDAVAAAR